MKAFHFRAVIEIIGVNPYVRVEKGQAVLIKAGWKKSMPVLVQINGKPNMPWHINMMPMGNGDFYLYLHGDVRKVSNTKVGDEVTVAITFDKDYRNGPMHSMPEWFDKALQDNTTARNNWEALVPSRKKEILRYFAQLKSKEAIERNLKKALYVLFR